MADDERLRWKDEILDRLRADGVKLTSHYSGSTVCAPSRFTLITGRHIDWAKTIGQGQQLA